MEKRAAWRPLLQALHAAARRLTRRDIAAAGLLAAALAIPTVLPGVLEQGYRAYLDWQQRLRQQEEIEALVRELTPLGPGGWNCIDPRNRECQGEWAANRLQQIGSPAVPALLRVVGSEREWEHVPPDGTALPAIAPAADPWLGRREAAIRILAAIDDARAVDRLAEVIERYPRLQERLLATEALGRLAESRAIPALTRALADGSVGRRAAYALAGYGDVTLSPLLAAARSPNEQVRANAAVALGAINAPPLDSRKTDSLRRLTRDPSPEVCAAAAEALGWTRDRRFSADLMRLLGRGGEAAAEAAHALGRLGDPAVIAPLMRLLRGPDEVAAVGAAEGLTEDGLYDFTEVPLRRVFGDPAPRVRRFALYACCRVFSDEDEPVLRRALQDPAPEVRWMAAALCQEQHLWGARGRWGWLLSLHQRDPHPRVREAAAAALYALENNRSPSVTPTAWITGEPGGACCQ